MDAIYSQETTKKQEIKPLAASDFDNMAGIPKVAALDQPQQSMGPACMESTAVPEFQFSPDAKAFTPSSSCGSSSSNTTSFPITQDFIKISTATSRPPQGVNTSESRRPVVYEQTKAYHESGVSKSTTDEVLSATNVQVQAVVPSTFPGQNELPPPLSLDDLPQPNSLSGLVQKSTGDIDLEIQENDCDVSLPGPLMEAIDDTESDKDILAHLGLDAPVLQDLSPTRKHFHSQPDKNALTTILSRASKDRKNSENSLKEARIRETSLLDENKQLRSILKSINKHPLELDEQKNMAQKNLEMKNLELKNLEQKNLQQTNLLSIASQEILRLKDSLFKTDLGKAEKEVIKLKAKILSLENDRKYFEAARRRHQELRYQPPTNLNQQLGKLLATNDASSKLILEDMGAEEIFRLRDALRDAEHQKRDEIARLRNIVQCTKSELNEVYQDNADLRPLRGEVIALKKVIARMTVSAAGKIGRTFQDGEQTIEKLMEEKAEIIWQNKELNAENEKLQTDNRDIKMQNKDFQKENNQLRKELDEMKAQRAFDAMRVQIRCFDNDDKAIEAMTTRLVQHTNGVQEDPSSLSNSKAHLYSESLQTQEKFYNEPAMTVQERLKPTGRDEY